MNAETRGLDTEMGAPRTQDSDSGPDPGAQDQETDSELERLRGVSRAKARHLAHGGRC